jgi:hypothetical protein
MSVAGTGVRGVSRGTGAPLHQPLDLPAAAAPLLDGSLVAADSENNKVVAVSMNTEHPLAGSGKGQPLGRNYDGPWNVLKITSSRNEKAGQFFRLRFRTSRGGWFRGTATPSHAGRSLHVRLHLLKTDSARAAAAQIVRVPHPCKGRHGPTGGQLACGGGRLIQGDYRVTLCGKDGSVGKCADPVQIHVALR